MKPYTGLVLCAIALLFVQAMCDLQLPNYMSDIVNVGLASAGIEEDSPRVISENGLALLEIFQTDPGKEALSRAYRPVDPRMDEKLLETFPGARDSGALVRDENADLTSVDKAYGRAAYAMMNYFQEMSQQNGTAAAETSDGATKSVQMDMGQLYQILPLLQQAPPETFEAQIQIAQQIDASTYSQVGKAMIRGFYEELNADLDHMQSSYIWKVGLQMLGITLLGVAAAIGVGFLAARSGSGLSRDLRHAVFAKVENFSNTEFDRFSTASLITRTTNDIVQVQMLVMMGIRMIFYAPIIGIGGVVMAVQKGRSISWIIAVACVLLIALILLIYKAGMPKFKAQQKLIDRLNLVSRENLTGIMAVRAFGNQDFEQKRFDTANTELTNTQLFINRLMSFMMPAMNLIMNLATLMIFWVGSSQVDASQMQVGDMMAFMQYAMQIIMAFLMISMMFIMVPRAAVSADRVAEILDTETVIQDPASPVKFEDGQKGTVEFRDVSFRYTGADENVLEHITFTARPGETTAFIGSTGSGKSTLVNLVPRFYDVIQGQVLVNGVDVRKVGQKALHDQIGYVPQKGVLHSGTIASNLRYGKKNATDQELLEAAKTAQAMEFISDPDVGFDKDIAQGGTNVSGGQKQRLSIARALVKKPPIYIFDDTFSALDFKTDAKLRKALKGYTGGATVLMVAQRVSTIMHAEQIIVLDEGKIVGAGTHHELLRSCPTYYEIASSQLSKEELE